MDLQETAEMLETCANHALEMWEDVKTAHAYLIVKRGDSIVSRHMVWNVAQVFDALMDAWNDATLCVYLMPLGARVQV